MYIILYNCTYVNAHIIYIIVYDRIHNYIIIYKITYNYMDFRLGKDKRRVYVWQREYQQKTVKWEWKEEKSNKRSERKKVEKYRGKEERSKEERI